MHVRLDFFEKRVQFGAICSHFYLNWLIISKFYLNLQQNWKNEENSTLIPCQHHHFVDLVQLSLQVVNKKLPWF